MFVFFSMPLRIQSASDMVDWIILRCLFNYFLTEVYFHLFFCLNGKGRFERKKFKVRLEVGRTMY